MSVRAAAVQMASTPDIHHNLEFMHGCIREAEDRGVDIIVFPEHCVLFTDNVEKIHETALHPKSTITETFAEWAAEYGIWMVIGGAPWRAPVRKKPAPGSAKLEKDIVANAPRISNACLIFNPDGELTHRYDKIHLFDAQINPPKNTAGSGPEIHAESHLYRPGNKTVVAELPFAHFGLSICYDLRFPELYRTLTQDGADILLAPSAFTFTTGQAHWDVLTRARAIENQCYVIAPAQVGSPYMGRKTYGFSRIIDPWGRVLAEKPEAIGLVLADLDLERQQMLRQDFPSLKHVKL
jgi:predicted amidohydrolase